MKTTLNVEESCLYKELDPVSFGKANNPSSILSALNFRIFNILILHKTSYFSASNPPERIGLKVDSSEFTPQPYKQYFRQLYDLVSSSFHYQPCIKKIM